MLIARLQKVLTTPNTKPTSSTFIFWLSLSLTFAIIYGLFVLRQAATSEYTVEDDARVYVFWMQRFVEPDLLPNDLTANYFQSVTPWGYAVLFKIMAALGIQPLLLSKLLPLILWVITTVYAFAVSQQLLPVPFAGFITTLLLNQTLLIKDDLPSGTPRAFLYPIALAFLYYLLRGSLLPVLGAIALMGLFYPQVVFILVGILVIRVFHWDGRPRLSQNKKDYLFCVAGIGIALLIMLPYALQTSEFGPTVTAAEMKTWVEFSADGRIPFFGQDAWKFWNRGQHTGIRLSINPPLVAAGFLLLLLLQYPSRFPLAKQVTKNNIILLQILLVSFSLFFAAHALLLKLYLPSRYTLHSLVMVMAFSSGLALTLLLDALLQWASQPVVQRYQRQFLAFGATFFLGATLLLYPNIFWHKYLLGSGYYVVGQAPTLYQFLQQQPKNSLIASTDEEASNLPVFAQRAVLVGREYANPYHIGYYRQIRQRAKDLIQAQYSPDLAVVKAFIQTYGINFWLLHRAAFQPGHLQNRWLQQYQPEVANARTLLEAGKVPALASLMQPCAVAETETFVLLQTECIQKAQPNAR